MLESKSVQMLHTATQRDIYIPEDIPVIVPNLRSGTCFD